MCFKVASVLAFALGAILYAIPASATTCTVPTTFTANTPAIAAQVNSNFYSLQTCGNNIDNANIGTAGIYATQIKPTNSGQATFGGSQPYTFSSGLSSTGAISTGSGIASSVGDGVAVVTYPSNNGANYTSLGVNTVAGYSGFSIAKLNSSQAFQSFLMGIDINGNTTFAGNGVFGSTGSFNGSLTSTSYTTPGNISASGTIGSTGNITSGAQINSSGTMTNTGLTANGNISASGTIGSTGNIISGAQINSSGTMTNTGLTANGNAGVSGTLAAGGDFTGSAAIYKNVGGTRFGIPFNANETTGAGSNHYEHGAIPDTNGSLGVGGCDGPFNVTFVKPYDVAPTVVVSANTATSGSFIITSIISVSASGFAVKTCNPTAYTQAQPQFLNWLALGE